MVIDNQLLKEESKQMLIDLLKKQIITDRI
jgi:hypothetical protein